MGIYLLKASSKVIILLSLGYLFLISGKVTITIPLSVILLLSFLRSSPIVNNNISFTPMWSFSATTCSHLSRKEVLHEMAITFFLFFLYCFLFGIIKSISLTSKLFSVNKDLP